MSWASSWSAAYHLYISFTCTTPAYKKKKKKEKKKEEKKGKRNKKREKESSITYVR